MIKKQIPKIGEWYWINTKDFEGRPYGKILQDITSKIYLVMLCAVKEDKGVEIVDKYFLCNGKDIGRELTWDEKGDYALVMEI